MFWPLEFLFFLIAFSVSAFVIRFFSSTLSQPGTDDGLTHMWEDDIKLSLKIGLIPATVMAILANI